MSLIDTDSPFNLSSLSDDPLCTCNEESRVHVDAPRSDRDTDVLSTKVRVQRSESDLLVGATGTRELGL